MNGPDKPPKRSKGLLQRLQRDYRTQIRWLLLFVGTALIGAKLLHGLWGGYKHADRGYITACLTEWGTEHADSESDMNMEPGSCPKDMPDHLRDDYTLNGVIEVGKQYKCQTGPAYQKAHHYTRGQIEQTQMRIRQGIGNYYSMLDRLLYTALDEFPLYKKDVVVLGSQRPVYESVCVVYGGRSCTVIDFQRITAEDDRVRYLTVADYDLNPELFDVAISLSSFEHDGLGRYGDPLRPNGDLAMMKKMKCLVRPGGLLFLSVPVSKDRIVWNMHRIYGKTRLPMLLKHWKIEKIFSGVEWHSRWHMEHATNEGDFEPLFILKNEEPEPGHNDHILATFQPPDSYPPKDR